MKIRLSPIRARIRDLLVTFYSVLILELALLLLCTAKYGWTMLASYFDGSIGTLILLHLAIYWSSFTLKPIIVLRQKSRVIFTLANLSLTAALSYVTFMIASVLLLAIGCPAHELGYSGCFYTGLTYVALVYAPLAVALTLMARPFCWALCSVWNNQKLSTHHAEPK